MLEYCPYGHCSKNIYPGRMNVMSKFKQAKNTDDAANVFMPIINFVRPLSKFVCLQLIASKSMYELNFYILDNNGKRIFRNSLSEEQEAFDDNKLGKITDKVVKDLRKSTNIYDDSQLNVYNITINNRDVSINVEYLENTGHNMYLVKKKWMLG